MSSATKKLVNYLKAGLDFRNLFSNADVTKDELKKKERGGCIFSQLSYYTHKDILYKRHALSISLYEAINLTMRVFSNIYFCKYLNHTHRALSCLLQQHAFYIYAQCVCYKYLYMSLFLYVAVLAYHKFRQMALKTTWNFP